MSHQEKARLRTFESDGSDRFVLTAGRSEADSGTIFDGVLDEGRYAIVPVDELAEDLDDEDSELSDSEAAIEDMQLVGETVVVPEDGHSMISLRKASKQIRTMDRKGAYGLLWVPFE